MQEMTDIRTKKLPAEKLAEASEALADYRAKEAATRANMLRLRAERLARDAANPPGIRAEPVKPKPRRKVIRS
jgi:hypothetical protein